MSPPARLRGFASAPGSPDQKCTPPGTTIARRIRAPARSPDEPSTPRHCRHRNHAATPMPAAAGSAPSIQPCSALIGMPFLSVVPRSASRMTTALIMQSHGPPMATAAPIAIAITPRRPFGSTTSGAAPPTRQCAPGGISSAHSGQRRRSVVAP